MTKTHSILVRGLSKEQKNSLKRIAAKHPGKLSINQLMLLEIEEKTYPEIAEYKRLKLAKQPQDKNIFPCVPVTG